MGSVSASYGGQIVIMVVYQDNESPRMPYVWFHIHLSFSGLIVKVNHLNPDESHSERLHPTGRQVNIDQCWVIVGQRRRRWSNINLALGHHDKLYRPPAEAIYKLTMGEGWASVVDGDPTLTQHWAIIAGVVWVTISGNCKHYTKVPLDWYRS